MVSRKRLLLKTIFTGLFLYLNRNFIGIKTITKVIVFMVTINAVFLSLYQNIDDFRLTYHANT